MEAALTATTIRSKQQKPMKNGILCGTRGTYDRTQ